MHWKQSCFKFVCLQWRFELQLRCFMFPFWVMVPCQVTPPGGKGCCDTRWWLCPRRGDDNSWDGGQPRRQEKAVVQSDNRHLKNPTCAFSPLTAFPHSVWKGNQIVLNWEICMLCFSPEDQKYPWKMLTNWKHLSFLLLFPWWQKKKKKKYFQLKQSLHLIVCPVCSDICPCSYHGSYSSKQPNSGRSL